MECVVTVIWPNKCILPMKVGKNTHKMSTEALTEGLDIKTHTTQAGTLAVHFIVYQVSHIQDCSIKIRQFCLFIRTKCAHKLYPSFFLRFPFLPLALAEISHIGLI